jgi:hypothetical protein
MVKKTVVILGVLAILASVGMSWGYTVAEWPVKGIPNTYFMHGRSNMVNPCDYTLRGPVAAASEPALIPGCIHAAISVPFRLLAAVPGACFSGAVWPEKGCGPQLDGPAYVVAAVPCTPVMEYIAPRGW